MDRIKLEKEKLIPFKEGLEAELYLYNLNNKYMVVKLYPENYDMSDIEEKSLILEKINVEGILKPTALVSIDNHFRGYMYPFRKNLLESSIVKNMYSIEERIEQLKKLYFILNELYSNGIIYLDLNPKNVLINDQKVVLVDMLNFSLKKEFDNSAFNLFAIYYLNNSINYYENLRKSVIPYLELAINDYFNKDNSIEIIGLDDINMAYDLIERNICKTSVIDKIKVLKSK